MKFEYYPASPFQKAEYFKHLYAKNKIKPFNCSINTILKHVEIESLNKVFDSILERYEIFRTTLIMDHGQILQKVWPYKPSLLEIEIIDISTADQKVELLNSIVFQRRYKIFFPDKYPWIDACLIKKDEDEYFLFINIPHMIIDGVSIGILKSEMNLLYHAFVNKNHINLGETYQFGDYLTELYNELNGEKGLKHRIYWSDLLKDPPIHTLTTKLSKNKLETNISYKDFILSELMSVYGNTSIRAQEHFWGNVSYINLKPGVAYEFQLEDEKFQIINNISNNSQVTISAAIQAIFCLTIFKMTGEKDFLIGLCSDLREKKMHKDLIGFMINTVMTRHKLDGDQSFTDFVKIVYSNNLKSFRHKVYPFDMVLYENNISLPRIGTLFLNIINVKSLVYDRKNEYTPEQYNEIVYNTYFDIDCLIYVFSNGIRFCCRYNPDLFSSDNIDDLFSLYKQIIDNLKDSYSVPISSIF